MAKRTITEDFKKFARVAAVVGAVLGLVCQCIPPRYEEYRAVCHMLASLCTGGAGGLP